MNRPTLEVADIFRAGGDSFIDRNESRIGYQQLQVMPAITRCRTAALGGHVDGCTRCGHQAISFNSCRTLVLQNQRVLYDLLFRTSAATLPEVAADPKHLGAEIGFFGVLHTWGQNLLHHPHVHYAVPAGGPAPDHSRWVRPRYPFFLPVRVLSRVFRGRFVAGLRQAFRRHQLHFGGSLKHLADPKRFAAFLRTLFRTDWVVYAKPAFGGPSQVLRYLGRYTIEWRSPTIGCLPSMAGTQLSAGGIMLTATGSAK